MSAAKDKNARHHAHRERGEHRVQRDATADRPADGADPAPDAGQRPHDAADRPAGAADLPQALAEKERERVELVDRLQRLAAEFSNYQKRMERRLPEERREAVRSLVLDLLPVIDNFERALASAQEGHDFEALFAGVRLVHDQVLAALRKHGVEPIEAAGGRFDPEHHEAVAHVPSDAHPSGHVIDEVQRGYRFGDRTLRASRVAVSSGQAGTQGSEMQPAPEPAEHDPSRDRQGAEDQLP